MSIFFIFLEAFIHVYEFIYSGYSVYGICMYIPRYMYKNAINKKLIYIHIHLHIHVHISVVQLSVLSLLFAFEVWVMVICLTQKILDLIHFFLLLFHL